MAYQIIHRDDIDKEKWYTSVAKSKSKIYDTYDYLDACTINNWSGIIWGDYEKVFPIIRKKKYGFLPYLSMPPSTQQFNTSHMSENEVAELVSFLKHKNILCDIRISKSISSSSRQLTNYVLLKKNIDYSDLQKNYSSRITRILNKKSMEVHYGKKQDVIPFLKSNDTFQKVFLNQYSDVFESLMKSENLQWLSLHTLDEKNEINGCVLAPIYNSTVYLLFPFVNDDGRSKQAMTYIIDTIIRDEKYNILDFEGSNIDSIANFYEQFGSIKEPYFAQKYVLGQ